MSALYVDKANNIKLQAEGVDLLRIDNQQSRGGQGIPQRKRFYYYMNTADYAPPPKIRIVKRKVRIR